MPDYYSASIHIGGHLNAAARTALAEAIEADEATQDYGGRTLTIEMALGAIDEAVDNGTSLDLYDDRTPGGEFHEIEATCAAFALPFLRQTEAKYGEDAECLYFDGAEEHATVTSQDGEGVATAREIRAAMATGTMDALLAMLDLTSAAIPPLTFAPGAAEAAPTAKRPD